MKASMKAGLTVVMVVLIAGTINTAFAAGYAGNRVIGKMVHPDNSRVLVVADNNEWQNPDSCDESNQLVLASGELKSYRIYMEMLTMLLSAQLSERPVGIRVDGCVGIGGSTYPIISQVALL